MHEVPSFERYYEEKVFMSKKVENQESKKKNLATKKQTNNNADIKMFQNI